MKRDLIPEAEFPSIEAPKLNEGLFKGQLVRLTAEEPEVMAECFARWPRNTEFARMLDTDPPVLFSKKWAEAWSRKRQEENLRDAHFMIRRLEDERLIGFAALWEPEGTHGESWFTIAVGEPDCWGKGYGTDATRLILRYAFCELNLQRVSLGVFGYNRRAMRAYEKAGFKQEGVARQAMQRAGQRYDIHFMGILRREWPGS